MELNEETLEERWVRAGQSTLEVFRLGELVGKGKESEDVFLSYLGDYSDAVADVHFLCRVAMVLIVHEFRKGTPDMSSSLVLESVGEDLAEELPVSRIMLRGVIETAMGDREVAEAISSNSHLMGAAMMAPRLAMVLDVPIESVVVRAVDAAVRKTKLN
jgi:hypothetical protein